MPKASANFGRWWCFWPQVLCSGVLGSPADHCPQLRGILSKQAQSLQSCPTLATLQTVARQAPLSMGFSRERICLGNKGQAGLRVKCVALWLGVSAHLCPALCEPMDGSPPGSSAHEIFQARILELVGISFSRGFSRPRDRTVSPGYATLAGRLFTAEPRGTPTDALSWCLKL